MTISHTAITPTLRKSRTRKIWQSKFPANERHPREISSARYSVITIFAAIHILHCIRQTYVCICISKICILNLWHYCNTHNDFYTWLISISILLVCAIENWALNVSVDTLRKNDCWQFRCHLLLIFVILFVKKKSKPYLSFVFIKHWRLHGDNEEGDTKRVFTKVERIERRFVNILCV